jgi:hypothetical protein
MSRVPSVPGIRAASGAAGRVRGAARTVLCALALLVAAARPLAAQEPPRQPLEEFVQQVAWLWNMGDVAALVDLLPLRDRVVLDTGEGTETVNPRHAAAALRALFDARETDDAHAIRVTLAGGDPPRGFGQLVWSFRTRGAPTSQSRSVYVGAVWQESAWRIGELRIMP